MRMSPPTKARNSGHTSANDRASWTSRSVYPWVALAGRHQHAAQRDLEAAVRRDRDTALACDDGREPPGESHGLGAVGRIGELVVPLFQRVPVRPDALRENLIDERR